MKTWTKSIEINAPIEHVWRFFDGSLEEMQKILPQIVEITPVRVTEEVVGSIYCQKFKEGKLIQEFDVETLEYMDTPDEKRLKVGFALVNLFEVTACYELRKINESKTLFTYKVTNRPLKWLVKLILFFATEKIIVKFVGRVKSVAEAETVTLSAS